MSVVYPEQQAVLVRLVDEVQQAVEELEENPDRKGKLVPKVRQALLAVRVQLERMEHEAQQEPWVPPASEEPPEPPAPKAPPARKARKAPPVKGRKAPKGTLGA